MMLHLLTQTRRYGSQHSAEEEDVCWVWLRKSGTRGYCAGWLKRTATLTIVVSLLWRLTLPAQAAFEMTPEVGRLLRNALDEMYRYELDLADRKFDELVRQFPEHPIGYMHKAEVVWWRALRNNGDKSLEAAFDRYTNQAVNQGQQLVKRNPHDFYALLYTAGAHGNRTRYYVYITRSYYRAMRAGLRGYGYVKTAQELRPDYADCLIGIGAYNYFAGALPAVIRFFSWMFVERGDKDKGIEQLKIAAEKGEYGRTAAKMVLLGAYYNEKRLDEYQQLLKELNQQYPSNPVFITWIASFYLRQRQLDSGIQFLATLLNQRNSNSRARLATAQAQYEKGRLEVEKRALDPAIASFTQLIETKIEDPPLQVKAQLWRAFARDLKGQREAAVADYHAVLGMVDIEDSHKRARRFLSTPYSGQLRN